jgi:hypothetical protein
VGTWTQSFSNTAPIIINPWPGSGFATPASPYPSQIAVSNLAGVVLKTTVTLTNLSHHAPNGIQVLMVAPNQQNTVLMAGDGGVNSVSDVTLTFDDASTNRLPAATPILTSTNQPTANTKPTFH